MVWLVFTALSISPFFGLWTYSADNVGDFYFRFVIYSLILTMWLPPTYTLILGLVLPRMRGVVFSTYLIIMTLLGQGLGPYLVGIVSDRSGGDLGLAIMSINVVSPVIVVLLFLILRRYRHDEASVLDRARAGGEPI